MNSVGFSLAPEAGKCRICSVNVKKKKVIQCDDCSEIFCNEHSRINPSDFKNYCIDCFVRNTKSEVDAEMEDQIHTVKQQEQRIKLKIKECKKEKAEKVQVIDRLHKLVAANNEEYFKKREGTQKKVEDEINTTTNLKIMIENLKVTIDDAIKLRVIAEELLIAARGEYTNATAEFDLLKQENLGINKQIRECSGNIKEFVPYTRLRSLACANCKLKIKKAFKNEILNGNAARSSIVQSVLAYRASQSRNSVSVKQSVRKEPDNSCKCIIC